MTENLESPKIAVSPRVELLRRRSDDMQEMSGIRHITEADTSGRIGMIDVFHPPQGMSEFRPGKEHGDHTRDFLRSFFRKIVAQNISPDIRPQQRDQEGAYMTMFKSTLDALSRYGSSDEYPLPNVINMSFGIPLPSPQSMKQEADEIKKNLGLFDRVVFSLARAMNKDGIRREIADRLEVVREIGKKIEELRNRGVVFVGSLDNYPNFSHPVPAISFDVPTIFPGVLGASAVVPQGDNGFARLGTKELADITSLGVIETPDPAEPYVEGCSFTLAPIAVDMVMNSLDLKNLSPGKRERIIKEVIGEASPRREISEQVRGDDGLFYEKKSENRVLSLKVLKQNLQNRRDAYLQMLRN